MKQAKLHVGNPNRLPVDDVETAFRLVQQQLQRVDEDLIPLVVPRYRFDLVQVVESDYEGTGYYVRTTPIGDDERAGDGELHVAWDAPRSAVESIRPTAGFVYRGLCWEEFQSIRRNCRVRSRGSRNFSRQAGLTFFGDAPTALFYASGFAPWFMKPAARRPGVVIGIPRSHTLSHEDDPHRVPEEEYAVEGGLEAREIKELWYVLPVRGESFTVPIWLYRNGKTSTAGLGPGFLSYAVMKANLAELRRRCG